MAAFVTGIRGSNAETYHVACPRGAVARNGAAANSAGISSSPRPSVVSRASEGGFTILSSLPINTTHCYCAWRIAIDFSCLSAARQ
jgi:hypothetical protein